MPEMLEINLLNSASYQNWKLFVKKQPLCSPDWNIVWTANYIEAAIDMFMFTIEQYNLNKGDSMGVDHVTHVARDPSEVLLQ